LGQKSEGKGEVAASNFPIVKRLSSASQGMKQQTITKKIEFMPKAMHPFKAWNTIARAKLEDERIRDSVLKKESFASTYDVLPSLFSIRLSREKKLEHIQLKLMSFKINYVSIALLILSEMNQRKNMQQQQQLPHALTSKMAISIRVAPEPNRGSMLELDKLPSIRFDKGIESEVKKEEYSQKPQALYQKIKNEEGEILDENAFRNQRTSSCLPQVRSSFFNSHQELRNMNWNEKNIWSVFGETEAEQYPPPTDFEVRYNEQLARLVRFVSKKQKDVDVDVDVL